MERYSLQIPENVADAIAARTRELRLAKGWKQVTLASRSGVTLASLRRFESSGRVSLQNLLKIAFALNRLADFDAVFESQRATSMVELETGEAKPRRKRGRL
jgi:transcriptional regulator with XRE-family HTH domain